MLVAEEDASEAETGEVLEGRCAAAQYLWQAKLSELPKAQRQPPHEEGGRRLSTNEGRQPGGKAGAAGGSGLGGERRQEGRLEHWYRLLLAAAAHQWYRAVLIEPPVALPPLLERL